jgi:hypothetical protein
MDRRALAELLPRCSGDCLSSSKPTLSQHQASTRQFSVVNSVVQYPSQYPSHYSSDLALNCSDYVHDYANVAF